MQGAGSARAGQVSLLVAVCLWVPVMAAASAEWKSGGYYDYGWLVPPAAFWLALRRWREDPGPARLPGWRPMLAVAVVWLPWMWWLRVLNHADPGWRLPMGGALCTALLCSGLWLGICHGRRFLGGMGWLGLLCISAVPWPSGMETRLVADLTRAVVGTVGEVFRLSGVPVETRGQTLLLHGMVVEVTDGCSGVRSLQGFLMTACFFCELFRLRMARGVLLLVAAVGTAWGVNTLRAYGLARIRFSSGVEAFERLHDLAGWAAFALNAVLFCGAAWFLSRTARREVAGRGGGA
jgi:exosortase